LTRELMLTTTGRSCFTSGASDGIWPVRAGFTASAVVGGVTAAACASAAKKLSEARRWHAETSDNAVTPATAPVTNAATKEKRRLITLPSKKAVASKTSDSACVFRRTARENLRKPA